MCTTGMLSVVQCPRLGALAQRRSLLVLQRPTTDSALFAPLTLRYSRIGCADVPSKVLQDLTFSPRPACCDARRGHAGDRNRGGAYPKCKKKKCLGRMGRVTLLIPLDSPRCKLFNAVKKSRKMLLLGSRTALLTVAVARP